jgi:hypothetical protein
LKACLPRIQLTLSITWLIPWLKSKPTELPSPSRAPPKLALPATVIAGPSTEIPCVRNWCRRAYCTRSSFSMLPPIVDTSWADVESMRSVKSVARSVVVSPAPMFDGERFLNPK